MKHQKLKTKSTIFIVCILACYSLDAQYIADYISLYQEPTLQAKEIGKISFGTNIKISEKQNEWSKIDIDNLYSGFVKTKFISEEYPLHETQVPEYLAKADEYYGSPHLFIIGASIKLRAKPDPLSSVLQILKMGTPVFIRFLPSDPESWVAINSGYIKRKYIGALPNLQHIFSEFNQIPKTEVEKRKTLAERAVELAWNIGKYQEEALEKFMQVAQDFKDENLIKNTEIQLILAKNLKNKLPKEELYKKIKFQVNLFDMNSKYNSNLMNFSQLQKKEKTLKTYKIVDECGIYISDWMYKFPFGIFSVDKNKNVAEAVELFFIDDRISIDINDFKLDKNTEEKAFVEKFSTWLDYRENGYSLALGDGQINFYFKDRKCIKLEFFYYC